MCVVGVKREEASLGVAVGEEGGWAMLLSGLAGLSRRLVQVFSWVPGGSAHAFLSASLAPKDIVCRPTYN